LSLGLYSNEGAHICKVALKYPFVIPSKKTRIWNTRSELINAGFGGATLQSKKSGMNNVRENERMLSARGEEMKSMGTRGRYRLKRSPRLNRKKCIALNINGWSQMDVEDDSTERIIPVIAGKSVIVMTNT